MASNVALPPVAAPAPPRLSFERRRDDPFRLSLLAAVAVHALLFLTVTFHFQVQPGRPHEVLQYLIIPDDAMKGYDLPTYAAPGAALDVAPRTTPATPPGRALPVPQATSAPPTPGEGGLPGAPSVAGAAGAITGGSGGMSSAAARLRQGYGDPRLLPTPDAVAQPELTESEWLHLRFAQKAGVYNDSIANEAAAKLKATDWTVKGKNGEKWGVSPGKIHLGKVTLPLPFGFSPTGQQGAELREATRKWSESQAQAARAEAQQTFEQRVKAIRERQQAQRDSTKKRGGD